MDEETFFFRFRPSVTVNLFGTDWFIVACTSVRADRCTVGEGLPKPKKMAEDDCTRRIRTSDKSICVSQMSASTPFKNGPSALTGAHSRLYRDSRSPRHPARLPPPPTITRSDRYGGQSFESRTRFLLRVIKAIGAASSERPLFVRPGATDWADGKWLQCGIGQTVLLGGGLKRLGVDLVDVSFGGNWAAQKIPVVPGYQIHPSPLSISPSEKRGRLGVHSACSFFCFYRFCLRWRSRRHALMFQWVWWG